MRARAAAQAQAAGAAREKIPGLQSGLVRRGHVSMAKPQAFGHLPQGCDFLRAEAAAAEAAKQAKLAEKQAKKQGKKDKKQGLAATKAELSAVQTFETNMGKTLASLPESLGVLAYVVAVEGGRAIRSVLTRQDSIMVGARWGPVLK